MAFRSPAWVIVVVLLSWPTAAAEPQIRTVAVYDQQAPGLPEGVHFAGGFSDQPLIDAAGRVLFKAQLSGSGFKPFEQNSLWLYDDGSYSLVARGGSQPPGMASGVRFTNFGELGLSSTGQFGFQGSLTGTGIESSNSWGHWAGTVADLRLVFQGGDPAPGLPGMEFVQTEEVQIGATGQTAFHARLINTSNNAWTGSIWTENGGVLTLLAHEGDQAPGMPAGVIFDRPGDPGMNAAGKVAFRGDLIAPDGSNQATLWSNGTGPLAPVVRSGDQAPGLPAGVTFTSMGAGDPVAINAAGQVAFSSGLAGPGVNFTNDDSLWRGTTDALSLVVRSGEQAQGFPAGVVFGSPDNPRMNAAGNVLFSVPIFGPGIDGGSLWLDDGGPLHFLVRDGDEAPGTSPGVVFASIQGYETILNAAGQVAFTSYLSGPGIDYRNEKGLWIRDTTGAIHLIVRQGQQLEVAPGDVRTISRFSIAYYGDNDDTSFSFFNARGQVAFWANFIEGGSGIFVSDPIAVPEPAAIVMSLAALFLLTSRSCWI